LINLLYSGCQQSFFGIGKTFYTLSRELTNASTADKRCSAMGGNLTMFKDVNVLEVFKNAANSEYTKGRRNR